MGVLSPNDQFLFVSNQLSNSVTVFNVAANGMLSLVPGRPFGGTGGAPSGMATDAAGTIFLPQIATTSLSLPSVWPVMAL